MAASTTTPSRLPPRRYHRLLRSSTQLPTRSSSLLPPLHAAASTPSLGLTEPGEKKPPFPLVCLRGQEVMRRALLVNAVDPAVGGVLIMGDRGTGKSIAVKALADIMPEVDIVPRDPFNSHPSIRALMGPEARARVDAGEELEGRKSQVPLVEVPLGSTEDRVCGTINMEKMFVSGEKGFIPGILYIDEVNLLDDGLVDLILDAAAGGWNTVEREGVSIGHPAKFMLVGSGILANGDLRPQLVDRFGLSVNVNTLTDREERISLAMDRIQYDTDPFMFYDSFKEEMDALKKQVVDARALLKEVNIPTKLQLMISQVCAALDVGLRADLTTVRGACALAALEGRTEVNEGDIEKMITVSVPHRMARDPLEPVEANIFRCRKAFDKVFKKDSVVERETEAKAEAVEEVDSGVAKDGEAKDERKGMKAGAWAGPMGAKGKEKDRGGLKPGQWKGI